MQLKLQNSFIGKFSIDFYVEHTNVLMNAANLAVYPASNDVYISKIIVFYYHIGLIWLEQNIFSGFFYFLRMYHEKYWFYIYVLYMWLNAYQVLQMWLNII